MHKLKIQNFQSIKDTSLEFNGFCIIKGKSDIGKSAVRRAIGVALYNEWDKNFIRKGTPQTHIEFSKEGEYSIKVDKSSKLNTFIVETANGRFELPKVGKDQPEEIAGLGFKPFSTSGDTYNLNVTTQLRDPLFMVAFKDTQNTKILNSLFGVDTLEVAQSLCLSDLRKSKQDYERTSQELQDLSSSLDKVKARKSVLERAVETVGKLENISSGLGKLVELKDKINKEGVRYQDVKLAYDRIDSLLKRYQDNREKRLKLKQFVLSSKKLEQEKTNERANNSKINKILACEIKLEYIEKIIKLQKGSREISSLVAKESKAQRALNRFSKIQGITKLINYIARVKTLQSITSNVSLLENDLSVINENIKGVEVQLRDLYPICDKCGQRIIQEQL